MYSFIPYISPTEYVILILYIIQNVGSWGRPGGIGAFFLILARNSDFSLMSHSTFIIANSGRLSSRNFHTNIHTHVRM